MMPFDAPRRFYSDDANSNNEYRAAGYTIELRDIGQYGFQLPPDQVHNTYRHLKCLVQCGIYSATKS